MIAMCLVGLPAFAADARVERDAQALRKKAIEEDSLNVDYAGAVKKLETALAKCGASKCGSGVKAGLLRDLGAMEILNGSVDEGKAAFANALTLDASLDLDPAYKNPMLEGIWGEVKKGGAPAAASPTKGAPAAGGEFSHTAPTEAQVRTPLAVYVEYAGPEHLGKVVAKYKGTGMTDWKSIDVKKFGDGFGALIPCKDVLEGSIQYYFVGFNAQNDPIATSGSRSKPYTVPVTQALVGPEPSLPGQEPPSQCTDTTQSECPPDFPGCKAPKKEDGEDCSKNEQCKSGSCHGGACVAKKGGDEECASDVECASGSCSDGKCSSKKGPGDSCSNSDECAAGSCQDGTCTAPAQSTAPRIWVGLAVQADIYFMPATSHACARNPTNGGVINSVGYACLDGANVHFPPDSNANARIISSSDQVGGGAVLGNFRVLLSLDYALNPNLLAGARLGYVFLTDPATKSPGTAFAPIHAEARLSYVFGGIDKRFAPLALVGLGVGEFDGAVPLTLRLAAASGAQAQSLAVKAWATSGPFFASLGGGARVLLTPKVALTAALKLEAGFGGTAGTLPGIAPELGIQMGL